MCNCKSFSQWTLGFVFGVLLIPGISWGYVYQCKSIWLENDLPPANEQTLQQVEDAMVRYLDIMGFPQIGHKKSDIDSVKYRMRQLSPALRGDLMDLIHENYGSIKSLKYSENRSIKSFKRQIDVLVTESTEAARVIAEEFNRHGQLDMALDSYYRRVQEVADTPMRMQGEDVLLTATRLQEMFFNLEGSRSLGPIVLYGSFINGRSYPKSSDLDFAVLNTQLEALLQGRDLVSELKEFPFSEAQPHVITPKQVHELGYLNNIVLLIHPDYIEVRVYQSHPSVDFQRARSKFDVYYF